MLNKKIMGVVAVGLSTIAISAQAATDGVYLGGTLGYGNVHQEGVTKSDTLLGTVKGSTFTASNKDTGLAGRLFAGYNFNQNLAAELGWTKFTNATSTGTASYKQAGLNLIQTNSTTIKTDAVDLVAKGTFPIANNFSVYGKIGAAYVIQRADTNVSGAAKLTPGRAHGRVIRHATDLAVMVPANSSSSTTTKSLLPTAGVGVSYAFNDKLSTELEYDRIQQVGNSKVNSTDFVGLGLTYSIG